MRRRRTYSKLGVVTRDDPDHRPRCVIELICRCLFKKEVSRAKLGICITVACRQLLRDDRGDAAQAYPTSGFACSDQTVMTDPVIFRKGGESGCPRKQRIPRAAPLPRLATSLPARCPNGGCGMEVGIPQPRPR